MNKIFKKIWNRSRGCFVAVSEAASSISKTGCKKAVASTLVLPFFCLPAAASAEVVWERDTNESQFSTDEGPRASQTNVVNGNFTQDVGLMYAVTDGHYHYPNMSLTVNGNYYAQAGIVAHFGHNRKSSEVSNFRLFVSGNATLDGAWGLGVRGSGGYHDGSIISNVEVRGVTTVNSSGGISNAADVKTTANVNLNVLNLSGVYALDASGGYSTINTVNQYGGVLRTSSSPVFHAVNDLNLYGGTTTNLVGIVVGTKSGNFSVGRTLTLGGGIVSNRSLLTQVGGAIKVTAGSYDFGTFNKSNGTLSNAGTLTVTQFNQSGGSASNTGNLTIGNADLYGSLTSSGTLALTGNVISRGNLSSTGTLNNRGSWTETDAFTITGNLNNTGAINFQNAFTFASNGKLNSSGTIQTNNASNIFDSLGSQGQTTLTTVSLDAQLPEEAKTALTDLFRHYVPGTVAQNLVDHAKFTGGKLIGSGVNLTQTQAADLTKAFKSKFFLLPTEISASTFPQEC